MVRLSGHKRITVCHWGKENIPTAAKITLMWKYLSPWKWNKWQLRVAALFSGFLAGAGAAAVRPVCISTCISVPACAQGVQEGCRRAHSESTVVDWPASMASHAYVWIFCFCSSSPGKDNHMHPVAVMSVQHLFLYKYKSAATSTRVNFVTRYKFGMLGQNQASWGAVIGSWRP